MLYEEKREVRLQISQLLADAGLTQKTIKDMVEAEIKAKVDRAIVQVMKQLDAESSSGNYIVDKVNTYLKSSYAVESNIRTQVENALKDRIINISFDKSVMGDK